MHRRTVSRVLYDRNVPDPLHRYLTDHIVRTTDDEGWSMLENGDLIVAAEQAGFDVMVTGDKNLQYQQNLTGRRLSLIVLSNTAWPVVRPMPPGSPPRWIRPSQAGSRS